MNKPYFSVGEEVLLISKSNPHLSGDHIVEHVLPRGVHNSPFDNATINVTSCFSYKLEGVAPSDTKYGSGYFIQELLRKKHKPSDESFSELMTSYREKVE